MGTVDFKDLGVYETFLEDFGKTFKYLHVDYLREDGWCLYLVTETFTEYLPRAPICNWYELGIWELKEYKELVEIVGEGSFDRFYKVVY